MTASPLQADIESAIGALTRKGLPIMGVEVTPDGGALVMVGHPPNVQAIATDMACKLIDTEKEG